MSREAQILRIEKISPNDGKGLRTVVFFKGCPLRCAWCSTPESQKMAPELYYQPAKCTSCGKCVEACPQKALHQTGDTCRLIIDRDKCRRCGRCAELCPSRALGVYGERMTVEQVLKQILKDEIFYYHSGGGVTLSGGDVLCQADFARELLAGCKDSGIHTMAELDMFGDYERIAMLLPYLDAFYVDIKLMDNIQHQKWTGVDNRTILENTRRAAADSKPSALHIRVPLIWNISDTPENIHAVADYCENLSSCAELEFLPYHRLGQTTYAYLWQEYPLAKLPAMSFSDAYKKVSVLKDRSLSFPVKVSGKIL